ncbi:MAG: hypothetical protein IKW39_01285 [Alphaproteobacteria bacterium]|nr:hypothetical protein [Alphaproteobacteria bacterium]
MSAKKQVAYIIGTILSFPIYVYHLLPVGDKKKKQKNSNVQKEQLHAREHIDKVSSQNAKRTCGHSQKSVRENHKKH